ncbi:cytochrome c biogenesis protein ResB [Cellulomonas endophytica]|uniref:cytochrome c biogenesis protein ResB n=1 Tax=Cellulomonas endophytica TaxID=2494735 RepID=UPI001012FE56|nr:cytochrome c biogenesis protein ResB [Cellulomonas endophytica]
MATRPYRPEGLQDALAPEEVASPPLGNAATSSAPSVAATDEGAQRPDGRPQLPQLSWLGWGRWAWRQLTSMRTALLLLMLLAVAAVPGTIFPQNAQDPVAVVEYVDEHPTTGPWLDRLGFFDVYSSVWFSAIYLLLSTSLVGCILPRSRAHLAALRARPPRTPRRFDRFPAHGRARTAAAPQDVVARAHADLRAGWPLLRFVPRHRVQVLDEGAGTWSVSAERGYLRESGNLLFHLSLVGLLVAIATGQMLHYRGQELVIQGRGFANAVVNYDTFEQGTAFRSDSLVPFTLRLDRFESRFDEETLQSRFFRADVTVTEPGQAPQATSITVNNPIKAGGATVYLMGNGYAPQVTVRDASGEVAFSGSVPFLPQDAVYTSRGVIKVPDVSAEQEQLGLVGYLLPTAEQYGPQLWRSLRPEPLDPLLVLSVWTGNLGLDTGVPQNVYQLDESRMRQSLDGQGRPVTLYLRPGDSVDLPDGQGTLTFEDLPRFAAFDLRHDPALGWVLTFALSAFAGLGVSLFAPRRRLWLRAGPHPAGTGTLVTAAGLARGEDIHLGHDVERLLRAALASPGR